MLFDKIFVNDVLADLKFFFFKEFFVEWELLSIFLFLKIDFTFISIEIFLEKTLGLRFKTIQTVVTLEMLGKNG